MDINTTPALEPPGNLESNFIDPPTLMSAVTATATLVLSLSLISVFGRGFVKVRVLHAHHAEDWFCYFALTGLITYTSILIYIEDYGFARHQWDITVAQFMHIMYYVNILYCIYGPTTLAAKLSVLFQIKRIFTTGRRDTVYWVIITSVVANIIVYTGLFFSYVFQCWPRERIWNTNVQGSCVSATSSNLAAGVLNLMSDLEALLLPAWAIWHLKMPLKRKLAAFAVFSVGSIACIIGVVGIYLRVLVLKESDFTWLCTKAALLVISEMAVVIIVGCIPSFPRLYHFLRGNSNHDTPAGRNSGSRDNYSFWMLSKRKKSSQATDSDRKTKSPLGNSVAKYLGPWGIGGMSTLGSRVNADEEVELTNFVSRVSVGHDQASRAGIVNGIWKTTSVEQETVRPDTLSH